MSRKITCCGQIMLNWLGKISCISSRSGSNPRRTVGSCFSYNKPNAKQKMAVNHRCSLANGGGIITNCLTPIGCIYLHISLTMCQDSCWQSYIGCHSHDHRVLRIDTRMKNIVPYLFLPEKNTSMSN